MKKTISVVALASLVVAGTAYGSAYRIPEQSADSTAKSGAHVASALGPDAAYYNPANMSWMEYDSWAVEGALSYIHLTEIEYEDDRNSAFDGETKDENFIIPTAFVVSPEYNGLRFGFSVAAPFGLAKRWPAGTYGATFAEKFSLKVIEANPTVSYRFSDSFSVAAGVRVLYSEATVMSNGAVSTDALANPIIANRYVDGDALDFGWNAALSIRPTEKSNVSFTFRSNVDLDFDGDVLLNSTAFTGFIPGIGLVPVPASSVSTDGKVTVPAPAVATISGSYTFDKLTVELTVDRTFWSAYEELDFNYDIVIANPVLFSAFDEAKPKDWEDANAYRIGLAYQWSDELILMGGLAYDENPVPEENLGFELPDSDAWIISVGARYAINEKSEVSFGLLYDYKESREATSADGIVDGEFTNASAIFATVGYTYAF